MVLKSVFVEGGPSICGGCLETRIFLGGLRGEQFFFTESSGLTCDGMLDHATWNVLFHYWDTKFS